jgi:SHS2 domain-containing protein
LPHRILSHTADTGVEASAPGLAALVAELAAGMFESMGSLRQGWDGPATEIDVEVSAPTPEDLVVDALSELLYESEVEDLFLFDFRAEPVDRLAVRVRARGVLFTQVETTGPPIKAVTYHEVEVVDTPGSCRGRVYFDV